MPQRLAYISENGIALKVMYRVASERKSRLYLQWMLVVSFRDSLPISEGKKEIEMANSNRVTAREMLNNSKWDCLLTKWDCLLMQSS